MASSLTSAMSAAASSSSSSSFMSSQSYSNVVKKSVRPLLLPLSMKRKINISCEATTPNTLEASTPETLKRVVEIVANQLATSIDSVNPHSKFQDLGADSLDQVEIVMALEEEFNISVSENGAESISTVQDAADLIERAVSEKSKKKE